MFNHYFFEEEGKKVLVDFLQSNEDDLILIMDPPFGGLVQVLAVTVNKIWKLWRECSTVKSMSTRHIFIDAFCVVACFFICIFLAFKNVFVDYILLVSCFIYLIFVFVS